MKKFITTFLMMAFLGIMIPFATATTANAQTSGIKRIYRNHRNLVNVGIGTAAGAILGGLIGGKKGALLGTAAGAGGAALYTYKINPKTKRYYRVRRY
ncbi:MAG: hypothetical protein ABIP06_08190 [Pyrinomonadaceae bacterium]